MVKIGIPSLFLLSILFVAHLPNTLSQLITRPEPPPVHLCASQFALANYACGRVPLNPLPPPSPDLPPPSPPDDSPPSREQGGQGHNRRHEHEHGHGHGHGHRHRHRHHDETSEERDCCRWVKEVDRECVCDILVHLPPFLSRPNHEYTVIVDETCNITYSCGGRLIRP